MNNLYYSSHDFTESKADCFDQTLTNFMATSLNPFCSNRLMMSAISPLWTASGLSIRNVRSLFPSPSPDIFKRELYALSSKPLYKEPVESLKATHATWAVNIHVTMPNLERGGGAQGVPKYFSGPLDMSPVDRAGPVSEIAPYIPSKSFVKFRCVHMRRAGSVFSNRDLGKRPSGLKILRDMDTSALLPG